jgi:hypothetical protein
MKIFILTLLVSLSAAAASVKVYVSLSPAGDFVAETESVVGNAVVGDNGAVEATNIRVPVKSLKSGINLRDQHMINKYLEADKYPDVILKIAKGAGGKGEAVLVIKGKEGKVNGTYGTSATSLKAEFSLKLPDFGITDISYKGIGVEDEVKVVAIVPLVKKSAAAVAPAAKPVAKPAVMPPKKK